MRHAIWDGSRLRSREGTPQLVQLVRTKLFSAYMFDSEYGWVAVHRLPLDAAIRYCKEYRSDWNTPLVAIVPDGEQPQPYFKLAITCGS